MSYSLVVAETVAKSRTLGAVLRQQSTEKSWRTIPTDGFYMDWPTRGTGIDEKTLRPKFAVKGKPSLNRIMAASSEASEVYLAMDAGPIGAATAYHLRSQIIGRWPDKVVKRLHFREITEAAISQAVKNASDVSELEAEERLSGQVLDRLITRTLGEKLGCTLGRAMAPAFKLLVTAHGSPEGRVEAHFSAGNRLVCFLSDPIPAERCEQLVVYLTANPPSYEIDVEDDLVAHPPKAYSTSTLLADFSSQYGLKSIETQAQAWSLYEAGYITNPVGAGIGLSPAFAVLVHAKIAALAGKSFCGRYQLPELLSPAERVTAIRPTSIDRDPSEIPKPVRRLYRMIWARTLAACSVYARVRHEIAHFNADGVRFEAEGIEVVEPGYDRVGLGLFLRKQVISKDLRFRQARVLKGGWPTESEFIETLTPMKLSSPAYVINSLEGNNFIEFRGNRIVPTAAGFAMLEKINEVMPEYASPMFFAQVEYRLRQISKGAFDRHLVLSEYQAWLREKERKANLPSLL